MFFVGCDHLWIVVGCDDLGCCVKDLCLKEFVNCEFVLEGVFWSCLVFIAKKKKK